jgi:hypothetical protein
MDCSNHDWMELTVSVMRELQKNSSKRFFSLEKDIIPLFKEKYPSCMRESVKDTKKEIEKLIQTNTDVFRPHSNNKGFYSLIKKSTKISKKKEHHHHDNPKKSSDTKKSSKKRKPQSLWCHQCKQKHNDILYCSKFYNGSCTKKYCKGCIERHYNESFTNIDKDKWICLFCRNLCVCAFCRRKRGEDVPKKVFKRKKSSIKDSPPSSPPAKKRKKNKSREMIHHDSVSSPIDESRLSPSSEESTSSIIRSQELSPESLGINTKPFSKNINSIIKTEPKQTTLKIESKHTIIKTDPKTFIKTEPKQTIVKTESKPKISKLEITLAHLLSEDLVSPGDKLHFIYSSIFIGIIQSTGQILLDWSDELVPNLATFTERCGRTYSEECLDIIICNGKKLGDYIELYYQKCKDSGHIIEHNHHNIMHPENNIPTFENNGNSSFFFDIFNTDNNNNYHEMIDSPFDYNQNIKMNGYHRDDHHSKNPLEEISSFTKEIYNIYNQQAHFFYGEEEEFLNGNVVDSVCF